MTIDTLVDEVRKAFWSKIPYRHVELRLTIRNDADADLRLLLEVLLPEALVVDVPGGEAAWHPSHRHELEGEDFLAWDTYGGFGRGAVGGVILPPGVASTDMLDVDLRPETNPVPAFWRLFEREPDDPAEPFHQVQLELRPYVPSL